MTEIWPKSLSPRDIAFNFAPRTLGGTTALSGFTQVVGSDAGYWKADFLEIGLRDNDAIMLWRTTALLLEGRLNPVLVPVFDQRRAPWPIDSYGRIRTPEATRHAELDGTAYEDPEIPAESAITATVGANGARRATQIVIHVAQGDVLKSGHFFSIGERLYQIRSVVSQVAGVVNVTIRPPLREAIVSAAPVEFINPVCKMRLASDEQMDATLSFGRWGFHSVSFAEDPF